MKDITLKSGYLQGRFELIPACGYHILYLELPHITGDSFVVNVRFKGGVGWLKFNRVGSSETSFELAGLQNLYPFIFGPNRDEKDKDPLAPHEDH